MTNHSRPAGRVEIREGVGRRRRWSAEEKGRIVAASFAPGANVCELARQHDLAPQHPLQWRRAARAGELALTIDGDMAFAPVVIDAPAAGAAPVGVVVEITGATIRVGRDTDLGLLGAVVRALKAAA